jgi:hypothetical protein
VRRSCNSSPTSQTLPEKLTCVPHLLARDVRPRPLHLLAPHGAIRLLHRLRLALAHGPLRMVPGPRHNPVVLPRARGSAIRPRSGQFTRAASTLHAPLFTLPGPDLVRHVHRARPDSGHVAGAGAGLRLALDGYWDTDRIWERRLRDRAFYFYPGVLGGGRLLEAGRCQECRFREVGLGSMLGDIRALVKSAEEHESKLKPIVTMQNCSLVPN